MPQKAFECYIYHVMAYAFVFVSFFCVRFSIYVDFSNTLFFLSDSDEKNWAFEKTNIKIGAFKKST